MKTLALLSACLALGLAGCASTGPAPAPEGVPEAGTSATSDKSIQFANQAAVGSIEPRVEDDPGYWEEIVCKREGATGSRQVTRRCHSRYDWARMEGAANEFMRDIWSVPVGHRD
jgi:hypothetical protein